MSESSIKEAIRDVRRAYEHLASEVADTFPIGSEINWDKGGHLQLGTVLHHGNKGDVRVENMRTGKQYWIEMYDVFGYVK